VKVPDQGHNALTVLFAVGKMRRLMLQLQGDSGRHGQYVYEEGLLQGCIDAGDDISVQHFLPGAIAASLESDLGAPVVPQARASRASAGLHFGCSPTPPRPQIVTIDLPSGSVFPLRGVPMTPSACIRA